MAFQPIVSWRLRRVFAYEALVRSAEPTLETPADLIQAAERLQSLHVLGRAIRARVVDAVRHSPHFAQIFVNLHAADLADEELFSRSSPLSGIAPHVVFEITERASLTAIPDAQERLASLRRLGYRIAVDDLGAGYAGLSSFALLAPEIAKLDMSLVRGVDRDHRKRKVIRSIATLCKDLDVLVVTEGVETVPERETLVELGCDLLQGFLFAKPSRGFPPPSW